MLMNCLWEWAAGFRPREQREAEYRQALEALYEEKRRVQAELFRESGCGAESVISGEEEEECQDTE